MFYESDFLQKVVKYEGTTFETSFPGGLILSSELPKLEGSGVSILGAKEGGVGSKSAPKSLERTFESPKYDATLLHNIMKILSDTLFDFF